MFQFELSAYDNYNQLRIKVIYIYILGERIVSSLSSTLPQCLAQTKASINVETVLPWYKLPCAPHLPQYVLIW